MEREALWVCMGGEEQRFQVKIEEGVWIEVRKTRDLEKGFDWAAVLTVMRSGRRHAVYLYDNAHGHPERHRYRGQLKLEAERLPTKGSARLDLPAAVEEIKAKWEGMVERWEP
ncbi:MAG TPA: hypothetical protein VFI03_03685 [Solirubrobacterales bacterium]|nr:hypothetical protein [Solirubrobacterales bacterium]